MTAPADDALFLVLHAVRIKGLAAADTIAEITALAVADVERWTADATTAGLLTYRDGRMGGYRLAAPGAERHAELLHQEMTDLVRHRGLEAALVAFQPLNAELKDVTTAWQLRDGTPNDHTDTGYDATVIDRLAIVHEGALRMLDEAVLAVPRFATYPKRLGAALARVQAGELAAFARPLAASYHDVWMELHQDLLLSLRRERSAEDGH
jgi:hypothetical protein